jgi:mannose-6-phosphate isomerase-like protein (cupin superfamily)/5-methylcytosine-specific restriction endonuclease McrA
MQYPKPVEKYECEHCHITFERRRDIQKVSFLKFNHILCKPCAFKTMAIKYKGTKKLSPEHKQKLLAGRKKYAPLTIDCKCCNKNFSVPYRERNRIYCGKICQIKSVSHTDIRKTSQCIICQKEFKHYGERIVCGRVCLAKYMSQSRIGSNNPASKHCIKEKSTCPNCQKSFEYTRGNLHKNQKRVFCSLACSHKISNKNHPQGNYNSKQYPFGWNKTFKNEIKNRDNYECQLCGRQEKEAQASHHIHHIDYNKKNLNKENLITLCRECHNMTHNGRTFWEIIFAGLLSGSKIVRKPWGAEIHITNTNKYCLKYLIFYKNKQFSFHHHNLKKELWHCIYGKLECVIGDRQQKQYLHFKVGDKIEVEPKIPHQLQAIQNSILVEVSTPDYPEDSIRLIEGIN